ncbi:hypothetical protein HY502_00975 [Candidatus Woesebacteria bacterium]|nr:hypothetical protein [Candidatus Woesebacteria bacterium]
MFKKLLVSFLIASVFLANFVTIASAQGSSWYNQSYKEWKTKVFESPDNEIFGERYTFAQVQWIIYSFSAIMAGTDLLKCAGLVETDPSQLGGCLEKIAPTETSGSTSSGGFGGALVGAGLLADSIISIHPASGVEYLAEAAQKFHLIPEASAQGFGFKSIEPIQLMWKAFRNMAYGFLVVVVLAMAFMIMFRVKVSPQVVISVQSALPRLVGILILITFSYAIAGFLVDLSYLIIGLIVTFVKSQGLLGNAGSTLNSLDLAQRVWGDLAAWGPMTSLILIVIFPLILIGLGLVAIGIVTGGIAAPATIVGGLLILIILLFIFIQFIKTLWSLLKAFVNVLLLIIFGPLLIMLGGFTPTIGGFGVWIKSLAANLAVFPTVALMAFIAHLIYWSFPHSIMDVARGIGFFNPFEVQATVASNPSFVLPIFSTGGFLTPVLAAMGILLIMPSAAELVKSIISGQPFNYGQAIGQAVGPIKTIGQGGLAGGVGRIEEGRRISMGTAYQPAVGTQILRTLGIIRT